MVIEATPKVDEIHVVMFPWFAFGHISPFVQLANKLSLHGIQVSFFSAPGNIDKIKSTLKLSSKVNVIPLSIPQIPGLPSDLHNTSQMTPHMSELLKQALDLMQPQILTILSNLKPHFVVFDFSHQWIPTLTSKLGIKSISFSVFASISGSYMMVPARLNNGDSKYPNIDDMKKPPKGFPSNSIKTIQTFQARDFMYVYTSFNGLPCVYDRHVECFKSCDAVIIKTCKEMEGSYVDYMKTQFNKPTLLCGPLVYEPDNGVLDEKWADWLSKFPEKSVLYCSFGSETFLTNDQIKELSLGLELTGLPFILVLNFPGNNSQVELTKALPEGFVERVSERGIVHTGWVQQQLVLQHNSVGYYLCHSGFSSVIEGIINDCQLVLLPLRGDQYLNSKLVAYDLKAGVEVDRRDEDGYFGKDDIFKAVQKVMVENDDDGKMIRGNHKKWKEFLLNKEIQNKFIADLVEELKAMVGY